MPGDAELLRRYAETRAEDAFAELVRRHLNGVYAAALRRVGGDVHLAQDVAQQVFAALARKAAVLAAHPVLTSWLHTATRHEAANVVRRERRRKVREQEAHAMHSMLPDAEAARDWSRVAPVLDAAIDELGETDRRAVLLRFVDRRPFAEIGVALRVTEDAARMRVERALEKLRARLADRGVTSTSAALGLLLANEAAAAAPAGLAASVAGAALAGAGGVVGPAATVLSFMSTSKVAVGTAALVLILALGGARHEVQARRVNETAAADAARKNEALAARLRELERQAGLERTTAAALAVAAPGPAPAPIAEVDPTAEGSALMARHPEVKQAVLDAVRADFRGGYAALFRSLGLSPAEIERCIDLQIQGYVRAADGPDGAVRFRLEGDRADGERQLRELLGEEGFQRCQDISGLFGEPPPLAIATEVARALYGTESPLTPAQANRVHELFTAAQIKDEKSRRQYDWDRIVAEGRGFLSETQLAPLALFRAPAQYRQFLDRSGVRQATLPASAPAK